MSDTRDNKIKLKDKNGRVLAEDNYDTLYSLCADSIIAGFAYGLVFAKKGINKMVSGWVSKATLDEMNVSQVSIPANFAGLEAVAVPTRLEDQLFDITDVVENEDYVEVTAQHIFYRQYKDYTLWKPEEGMSYSCGAVCRNVMSNAISDVGFRVATDCTDQKPGSEFDYERKSIVESFLDPENGICKKFGLSLIRDNDSFYVLKDVGYDRGIVIQDGKNMLGVERIENTDNIATRVAPFGKDKSGKIVWLNNNGSKYIDSSHINDYPVPYLELYDTELQIGKDDVTADNIQAKLLEAGQKRFSEDKVDLPEVTMRIEFVSLGDTEEYAQYRGLDKVYLYDILTIKDTVRGYNYSAQVIGVEHDILTGMLNSVTIGTLKEADASRKIAVWQVPEISGENIRLASIMSGSFAPGAITSDDLATGAVHWVHLDAASITELTTQQLEALQANIHTLIAGTITADDITAGSITTDSLQAGAVTSEILSAGAVIASKIASDAVTSDKIYAGAVTAEKLGANAVTAQKISAGAVTAEKIQSGAINADKIDASAISAINAKLGTATIANGYINNADIDFARLKDAAIDDAIITTSITEKGTADRLYINRLMVSYGQMVEATIGDLVIGASNGNYYHVDVDWDEDGVPTLVPTQVTTPSAAEIASGHTTDGKTIIQDVGTFAELSSEDFYAINGIIDRITAKRIDVDELWARQAFIGKLMTTDISSNTYIQSTIGDWQSGSTITQTINSIDSRISSLGYGTIFYSSTEPSASGVVIGDIWIEPIDDNTWNEIAIHTWQELESWTWDQVAGQYRMYVWTGTQWKLLFDNLIVSELMTEIQQTEYAVTLKADATVVDALAQDVTDFAATLEIQAQQITAAVSAVNLKVSGFVQAEDPSLTHTLSVGDTWTVGTFDGTWNGLSSYTWDDLADFSWNNLAGSECYVWSGSEWIPTSDLGFLRNSGTLIEQNERQIALVSQSMAQLQDQIYSTYAELRIMDDRITTEVGRATSAEATKIEKTSTLQTADQIVTEAVRQSGVAASGVYIAKTTTMQTADAIVTEAVRQSAVAGSSAYLAKTSVYQTAEAIVTAANTYTNNQLSNYSTISQTSSAISAYVASNAYQIRSGVEILNNQVRIYSGNVTSLLLNTSGIDMQTAGKAIIHAADGTGSSIIFGTNEANATFMVGMSGDMKARSLVVEELTVNGKGYPGLVVSETMPSGHNVLWFKPTSDTSKQWSKTPDQYTLNSSGGTLGWYRDFTIPYSAADYLAGSLYYGIKARLYYYARSFMSVHFKARLANGNSWIELGNTSDYASEGTTITLDTMMSSPTTNIMNVMGGTFTVRLETDCNPGSCRLVIEDILMKAKSTSGSGAAACSLFYIN